MTMTDTKRSRAPALRDPHQDTCPWPEANQAAPRSLGLRRAAGSTRHAHEPRSRAAIGPVDRSLPRSRSALVSAIAVGACLLAGGCTSLLPSSRTEVVSDWRNYDDAVKSLATVAPYTSTRHSVHAQGLDPSRNPAITVLHFADVLQRFAAATLIEPKDVDRGIRDCLQAGKQCSGYAIAVEKLHRQRVGSFWLDSLSFRRETVTTGWRVDVLLVFVDDALVYKLVGGRPTINEVDLRRNPLGPLQGWGDQSLQMIR